MQSIKRAAAVAGLAMLYLAPLNANANNLCDVINGAVLVAQDNKGTFLGVIVNEFDSDSIFNEFGNHGSEFSAESIWNEFGSFGGEFSQHSPFNEFTNEPPMIIKNRKILGYLTVNEHINGSLNPFILKGTCHSKL